MEGGERLHGRGADARHLRRYAHALRRIVTSLVEERLARRHKKGIYLIERAAEAVLAVLRYDDDRQIMTTPHH